MSNPRSISAASCRKARRLSLAPDGRERVGEHLPSRRRSWSMSQICAPSAERRANFVPERPVTLCARARRGDAEPVRQPARLMNWSSWGRHMYLRGNPFGPSTSLYDDCRSTVAVGFVLVAYVGFFFALYWLMQPSVSANPGLAGYRPPPKTVVHYADSPWVPPAPSEALPIPAATEPAPEVAKSSITEEPKKETKKQEARTTPRRARPVREQPNPFWGYASSRSSGSRPWF